MNRRGAENEKFVFLDDNHQTLASAVLLGQQGQIKSFRLIYAPNCDLQALSSFNVLSVNSSEFMAWRGRIQQIRGDVLDFIAEERIDSRLRRHLRIPMAFRTYIYPLHGHGTRLPIISKDISCGGIAFYGQYGLENGETLEIVIPITANPLVLRCEILRQQTLRNNRAFYAAKFVDMCNDEETLLREAVFRVQLEDRPRRSGAGNGDMEVER